MKIQGTEGMSAENIRDEINRGGRVVGYLYCVSIVLMTFKQGTGLRLIKAGHSPAAASWPYTALTLLLGWWGIPWGPIYSIECLYKNSCGGIDVTEEVLRALSASSAAAPSPGAAEPPSLTLRPAPARGFNWRAAGGIAAVAALTVLVGVTGYCFYQQQNLTVVLTSGIDEAYQVTLNGRTHTLKPHGNEVLELPEGEFVLADAGGGRVVGGEQRFTFKRPLLDHLGAEQVAIINPDRCALVADVGVTYYANDTTPPAPDASLTLHANQFAYFIPKPDYLIDPPPANIPMPSGTRTLVKRRLDISAGGSVRSEINVLQEKAGYDAAREHLRLLARYRTDEKLLLAALVTLKPEDVRNFLRAHLTDRPVLVEWHRYYQNVVESYFPNEDLVTEYRALLRAEPDNGALHYLLGRVVDDAEQPEHWRAALAASKPCAYAHAAIGYDHLSRGHPAEALAAYEASLAAHVDSLSIRHYWQLACIAAGRPQVALAHASAQRRAEPLNIDHALTELRLTYAATHDQPTLTRLCDTLVNGLRALQFDDAHLAEARRHFDAETAYLTRDLPRYADLVGKLDSPAYRFRAAFVRGDLTAATQAIPASEQNVDSLLLLYLLAQEKGDTAAADGHFAAALSAMKEQKDFRFIAAQLAAERPDAAAICARTLPLERKSILLTALGTRYPSDRATYFAMARQMNISPDFPQHYLGRVLTPAT